MAELSSYVSVRLVFIIALLNSGITGMGGVKMNHAIVAFDVDGCLIDIYGQTNMNMVDLARFFHSIGFSVVVWTGGGVDRAKQVVRETGLEDIAAAYAKGSIVPDICFDDMEVNLAEINIRVHPMQKE